jgi:hypothetical protein
MTERQLTFTDLDENPLVVQLKQDRIELAVYDSRPELAAGELRAFVSALFAEYLGPHLVIRLTAARARLLAARDGEAGATTAALDDALRALDDVARVMTEAGAIEDPQLPPLPLTPVAHLTYAPLGGPRRTRRARRCEEASTLHGWGWRPAEPTPVA